MKAHLEVINKPLRYATRRLMPGDDFLAKRRDALALIIRKRAREVRRGSEEKNVG